MQTTGLWSNSLATVTCAIIHAFGTWRQRMTDRPVEIKLSSERNPVDALVEAFAGAERSIDAVVYKFNLSAIFINRIQNTSDFTHCPGILATEANRGDPEVIRRHDEKAGILTSQLFHVIVCV